MAPMNPPPLQQQEKTSGLAIASLVLGILSFCCGILLGIPAIITGIIARKKIRASLMKGDGLALAGIIIGGVSFVMTIVQAAILVPTFVTTLDFGRQNIHMIEAQNVVLAIESATQESKTGGKTFGAPADIGATSASAYIGALVPEYLSQEQADSFLQKFEIGNVSANDAPETILIRSKPGSATVKQPIIFTVDGSGQTLWTKEEIEAGFGEDPPRTPTYLAD